MGVVKLSSQVWGAYKGLWQGLQRQLSNGLGHWGAFVARRPVLVLVTALILALACLPGLLLQPRLYKTQLNDVWVDKTSKSYKDYLYVDPNYPSIKYVATVTMDALNSDRNVIKPEVVQEALKVHEAAMAVRVTYKGVQYSYPDICYRLDNGWCDQNGFLSFWNFSTPYYQNSLIGYPSADAAVIAAVNVSRWPDGREVVLLSLFSDDLRYDGDVLVGAVTSRWAYELAQDLDVAIGKTWARAYTKAMKAVAKELTVLRIYHQHTWASDDEVNNQISGNLPLMAACVVIVCSWAVLVFSRRGCIRTRTSLGFLAFGTVILGTAAGYGLSLYFQIIFALLQLFALPFIMLALGIDMTFVVLAGFNEALDHLGENAPLELLFSCSMKASGLSITTTTLASIFAFALGATTKIPAIRSFCGNAALCLLLVYMLTLSFFVACVVLTEKRIRARRNDCCCCWKGGCMCAGDEVAVAAVSEYELEAAKGRGISPAMPPTLQLANKMGPNTPLGTTNATMPPVPLKGQPTKGFTFSDWFGNVYGRALTTPIGAIIVFCIFFGWVAMSAWAIQRVKEGLPNEDLLPDNSYLQPLIKRLDQTFFRSAGANTGLYFRDMDFSSPVIQQKMNQAWYYAKHYRDFSLEQSPKTSWLSELADYVSETNPELVDRSDPKGAFITANTTTFYTFLHAFLQGNKTSIFSDRVIMQNNTAKTGTLLGCKFGLVHRPSQEYSDTGHFLERAREAEKKINKLYFAAENSANSRDVALIFGGDYTYWQLSYNELHSLWVELGFAFLGAVLLMMVMLVHPMVAIIVVAAVVCVVVCLFGELYVFGLRLNPISAINMLMAVGLSIDYVLYATHKFLMKPGSDRRERVILALHDIGAAVFLGASSTVCGMAPLLLGTSAVFRYFAYLMIGTVIFGVFAGLAVVPVVMWLIGPERCIDDVWRSDEMALGQKQAQAQRVLVSGGFAENGGLSPVERSSQDVRRAFA